MELPIDLWVNIITNAPIAAVFGVIIYVLWKEYQKEQAEDRELLRRCLGYDEEDDK